MATSSRWRAALASAAAAAVLITAPLMGAGPAHAQYPPGPPSVELSATTVAPGGTITFEASGFAPGQLVTAYLFSRVTVLGTYRANAEGEAYGTVTIPRRTKPGLHAFELVAENPDLILAANITVTGGGRPGYNGPGYGKGEYGRGKGEYPHLADTGNDDSKLAVTGAAAAGLVATGAGAVVLMRRRSRS
ncbi:hypothetical protein H1V43_06135 [Streptomyces sp. PSKA54]|uniref:Gram-positive cocci surface proteins LPxTG domain-containing protein n=1 Tax=Streptomyces himalayensis subsp. aureolus TaxID=2758039 RepID=A0A7W2CXX0_9ACTN|nr:hypothetical protein [Streptomyces himalayensis]MBA4860966.1 hypothetical protein [Streptomyces himalayensis subsp. aureolus]